MVKSDLVWVRGIKIPRQYLDVELGLTKGRKFLLLSFLIKKAAEVEALGKVDIVELLQEFVRAKLILGKHFHIISAVEVFV